MNKIAEHYGHKIVIARYTDGIVEPAYSVECEQCFEVIVDDETLEPIEEGK
jgi:hypothetical protein